MEKNKSFSTKTLIFIAFIIIALGGFLLLRTDNENNMEKINNTYAIFDTTKGKIKIELFTKEEPITTANFIKLAKSGFYDGTKFHRVIDGFMIQGGDPNSKSDDTSLYGAGGPGYTIEDEFLDKYSNVRGTISMANTGTPNSGGSQFFINVADNTNLDFNKEPFTSKHPVFGRVVNGIDVVDSIAKSPTKARDIPIESISIIKITIE